MQAWLNQLHSTFIEGNNYLMLIDGIKNTFIITIFALAIGFMIGILISVIKFFADGNRALKPLAWICNFYVTAIRGIPVVVLLLIFYFVILKSSAGIVTAIVAFGINSGAYTAEIIRSGIAAVDFGQMEAAVSLGMPRLKAMVFIIMPQAIKNILPAIGNEMISLLKETSVAGYVAVQDLTRAANLIRNNTFDSFNPLMLTAVVYLSLVVIMTALLNKLEKHLHKSDRI